MDNIFFNCVLNKKVVIQPKYLNEKIDDYILEYLINSVQGKCIYEGYVKPDTIKIIKKSIGMILGNRFTGDITYNIIYTADVCNPVIGNIIECKVKFINKLGILANNEPLKVIVGKQFHSNDIDINKISENDMIKVEVIAKKFNLNDKEIRVVGKLFNEFDLNNGVKVNKKEIMVSDLPVNLNDDYDGEYNMIDDQLSLEDGLEDGLEDTFEDTNEDDEQDDDYENEFEDQKDDDFEENKGSQDIVIHNPDDNNINVDDIEIDESESESEDEEYDDYSENEDYK